jgi:hypothetical protein
MDFWVSLAHKTRIGLAAAIATKALATDQLFPDPLPPNNTFVLAGLNKGR